MKKKMMMVILILVLLLVSVTTVFAGGGQVQGGTGNGEGDQTTHEVCGVQPGCNDEAPIPGVGPQY